MRTTFVNLAVERETAKAYLTTESGWLPKSAVNSTANNKFGKVEKICGVASWIVSKKPELQENAKKTKAQSNAFNIEKFGTSNPSLKQIASAIADKHEEEGRIWNPIVKDYV